MAIAKFIRDLGVQNSNINRQSDRHFLLVVLGVALLVFGCGKNQLNQCEQIFKIAREVNNSSQAIAQDNPQQLENLKSWLETARKIDLAADKIQALHINNMELIEYQNKLATIYRIYARATYDAVVARENRNREALVSAREDALAAGAMQQDLLHNLNDYCLNR